MPQQLILEWAAEPPPGFENFVAGANAEPLMHLRALAAGRLGEASVVIWGAPGVGKSHLIAATLAAAVAAGRVARMLALDGDGPFAVEPGALYAVDDIDRLDPAGQGRLFTAYNACREAGAQLLLATRLPPMQAPLRDDLRTRAGWGLVLELKPLSDEDKPGALAAFAQAQGFRLGPEVIDFLLTRGRRDMGALLATLRALDRHSLATRRPVTVPMLRELLQPELGRDARADPPGKIP